MKVKECKKGKIIIGNSSDRYSITTDKAKMKILNVYGSDEQEYNIRVKIIDHETKKWGIGCLYDVKAKYFNPVENSIKKI